MAEHGCQLVLGGDDGDLGAGVEEGLEDGIDPEKPGRVRHHVQAGVAIEEEVGADAVDGRGDAGDDGHVVGIGKTGHHAIGEPVGAFGQDALEERRLAGGHGGFHVSRFGTVHTHHDQRLARPAVGPPVDVYGARVILHCRSAF